jgi:hypothetical protein
MATNKQLIKLSDQLSLYSGDVIILNNSEPYLVEVIDNQSIKLRKVDKSDKYLAEHSYTKLINKSLKFAEFDKSLVFIVKEDRNGQVALQIGDKYLDLDNQKLHLSPEDKLLTITKLENVENIANYQEEVEITKFRQDQATEISDRKLIIATKSYNNKTNEPLEYNFELSKEIHKEHNLTLSKEITLGAKAKLSIATSVGLNISGKYEQKSTTSNSFTKTETETIKESLKVNCAP